MPERKTRRALPALAAILVVPFLLFSPLGPVAAPAHATEDVAPENPAVRTAASLAFKWLRKNWPLVYIFIDEALEDLRGGCDCPPPPPPPPPPPDWVDPVRAV